MKKIVVNILSVSLLLVLLGPFSISRSISVEHRSLLFNAQNSDVLYDDGLLWLKESADNQESKSKFSKWKPVILTVAVGGAIFLVYSARSS